LWYCCDDVLSENKYDDDDDVNVCQFLRSSENKNETTKQ